MKKMNKFLILLTLSLFAFSSFAKAESDASQPATQAVDKSSAEFKRIKSLEGRWKATTSMFGKENEEVFTEYQVTAGGSAVLEKIFPGTPNEMISVYYDDENGKLNMTHYCIMKNRPQLKLSKSDKKSMVMDIVKVEGLTSQDEASMGDMTLVFKDKDHFSSTCKGRGKGMENQKPHTMDYTRVK